MRKLFFLLMVLALLTACSARADLFPEISVPTREPPASTVKPASSASGSLVSAVAPSYGGMANAQPVATEQNDSGLQEVKYKPVDISGYFAFGSYLDDRGYSITELSISSDGSHVVLLAMNGDLSFYISYDANSEELILFYESGLDYEEARSTMPAVVKTGTAKDNPEAAAAESQQTESSDSDKSQAAADTATICPHCNMGRCWNCDGTGTVGCNICSRSGICSVCFGKREFYVPGYGNGGSFVTCKGCNGSGQCSFCKGRGTKDCIFCDNGTCRYCHGDYMNYHR